MNDKTIKNADNCSTITTIATTTTKIDTTTAAATLTSATATATAATTTTTAAITEERGNSMKENSNENGSETTDCSKHIDHSSVDTSYYLVCNYCKSSTKYKKFDEFLLHIKAAHHTEFIPNSHIDVNAFGIMVEKTETVPFNSRTDIPIASYNLRQLSKAALLDIIRLFSQCACLWPSSTTRLQGNQFERFSAYKLLLKKLREHEEKATMQDVRNIVQQLIATTQKVLNGAKSKLPIGDCSVQINIYELNPPNSRIILESLLFLIFDDSGDIKMMDVNKLCSFCNKGFPKYDDLWEHMKAVHISEESSTSSLSKFDHSTDMTTVSEHTKSSSAKYNAINHNISNVHKSNSTEISNTDNNCTTSNKNNNNNNNNSNDGNNDDNKNNNNNNNNKGNIKSTTEITRRSSLVLKNVHSVNSDLWKEGTTGLRLRKRRAASLQRTYSECNTTSDESDLDVKPSLCYLSQYNDEFLIKFIDTFRQKECLWNVNSDLFKNHQLKEEAYKELVQAHHKMLPHQPKPTMNFIKNIIRRLKYYYKRCQSYKVKRPVARHYIWQKMSFMEEKKHHNNYSFRSRNASCYTLIGKSSTSTFNCTKCPKKFKRAHYLNNHMIRQHPPTKCSKCSEDFDNADNLNTHILWYHRKDTECPLCITKSEINHRGDWKSNGHLTEHFYDFQCDDCERTYHDYTNYSKHRIQCRQKHKNCKCYRYNKNSLNNSNQYSPRSIKKQFCVGRITKSRIRQSRSNLKYGN